MIHAVFRSFQHHFSGSRIVRKVIGKRLHHLFRCHPFFIEDQFFNRTQTVCRIDRTIELQRSRQVLAASLKKGFSLLDTAVIKNGCHQKWVPGAGNLIFIRLKLCLSLYIIFRMFLIVTVKLLETPAFGKLRRPGTDCPAPHRVPSSVYGQFHDFCSVERSARRCHTVVLKLIFSASKHDIVFGHLPRHTVRTHNSRHDHVVIIEKRVCSSLLNTANRGLHH